MMDMKITGKTRLMGIIGQPVEHSLSPYMHNALNCWLEVDAVYVPLCIDREGLPSLVQAIRSMDFIGFNVTMPYKEDIIEYLDEASEEVRRIGSANTVQVRDGKLFGHNTDGRGFVKSFTTETGRAVDGLSIAILGAGGAARSVAMCLAQEGCKSLHIINRSRDKAAALGAHINTYFPGRAEGMELDQCHEILAACDVIINTTSVGMGMLEGKSPLPEGFHFHKGQIAADLIYQPARTYFLEQAEQVGCEVLNGLGMLVWQGIFAYEIWTGITGLDAKAESIIRSLRK